jgi:hypothetical protein
MPLTKAQLQKTITQLRKQLADKDKKYQEIINQLKEK